MVVTHTVTTTLYVVNSSKLYKFLKRCLYYVLSEPEQLNIQHNVLCFIAFVSFNVRKNQ
jgi:hypothetical protein